jgi:hypothetical protein
VLVNSGYTEIHRPYHYAAREHALGLFFRDRLSDLIGFQYAKWNSHDAAANFVAELETIAAAKTGAVVTVALDGENCWEFPFNGYSFLSALYLALAAHPGIRTATFRDCLAERAAVGTLERVVAGSWVNGDLGTWDLLCAGEAELRSRAGERAPRAGARSSRAAPARRLRGLGRLLVGGIRQSACDRGAGQPCFQGTPVAPIPPARAAGSVSG